MKILPNRSINITTNYPLENIISKLQSETEEKKIFRSNTIHLKFQGVINEDQFLIERINIRQNSFKAIAHGKLSDEGNTRNLSVDLKMHDIVTAFWICWMIMVILACIGVLLISILQSRFELPFLIPIIMVVFGWFLCHLTFDSDATQLTNDLLELTGGKLVN